MALGLAGFGSRGRKCSLSHRHNGAGWDGLCESPSRAQPAAHHAHGANSDTAEHQIQWKFALGKWVNSKSAEKRYLSKIIATREFRLNLIKLFWLQTVMNFF